MSSYLDIKGDFLREAAQTGWLSLAEVNPTWRHVPEHILTRWLRQAQAVIPVDPASPQRLVNHFKLGGDPEFAFAAGGDRESAMSLNFRAAQAWGADNNGRLAEIRPAPHRSALFVTASVWSTLVWMTKLVPSTLRYSWRSGAWFAGDGMGGHIHLGRKRPSWEREMQALDTLAFYLQHINIFNQAEWNERIRRTRGHGNYGQLGDRRVQAHGWEYRTIPSWLDSPWLAYCVLTLSKLAVFDPEFLPVLTGAEATLTAAQVRVKLRGLLSYFKSRDDDAAIAHAIYSRHGWPHFDIGDFKARWGIFVSPTSTPEPLPLTTPNQISATPEMAQALAEALISGHAPQWGEFAPTWTPSELPAGYLQALNVTETYHHPGLGELVRDLAVPANSKYRPVFQTSGNAMIDIPTSMVPTSRQHAWRREMNKRFPSLSLHWHYSDPDKLDRRIFLPGDYATNPTQREQTREFLTSGWAPIWKLSEVREDSLAHFLESQRLLATVEVKTPKPKPSQVIWPLTKAKPEAKLKSYAMLAEEARRRLAETVQVIREAPPTTQTVTQPGAYTQTFTYSGIGNPDLWEAPPQITIPTRRTRRPT